MKKHLIVILLITSFHCFAQVPDSRGIYVGDMLEDIDMGWMNTIVLKEPSKPYSGNGWNYTAAQTDASQKIGVWLQQTFTQTGLLGEIKLALLAPPPSYPINSKEYDYNEAEKNNRNALPNTYGAWARFHKCISRTATKKFWPTPGNHCYMGLDIMVNNVQLISKQIVGLSSTNGYYCVLPRWEPGMKGRLDKDWMPATLAYRNFDKSPNLKNYEHYVLPGKLIDANTDSYVVILKKDNTPLPFEPITMREFINRLEEQFPLLHKIAVNQGLTTRMPTVLQDAKRGLQILKNKFKNELNNYAYVADINTNIDLLSLSQIEEGKEIPWIKTARETTSNGGYTETHFPVMRLKKGVKETLTSGAPQWIVCKIDAPINASHSGSVQMMDNFVSRFNYDYVHRYFFGKEKVIEPYKPLGPIKTEEKAATAAVSATAEKNAADKSVLFFEDFSGTTTGASPQNWTIQRSEVSGNRSPVTTLEKVPGNWLQLKRGATPKTFPQISGDFELSFDLLVHKGDVPWGTPGINVQLQLTGSTGEKTVTLNVSPGDMNRADAAGWVMFNGLPNCKVSSYYSLPDFTGSKPVNKANISVRRKGESITVLCNNNKVYDCNTAFSSGLMLKGLNFTVNEKNQFYLSNIQIKKI